MLSQIFIIVKKSLPLPVVIRYLKEYIIKKKKKDQHNITLIFYYVYFSL